MNHTSPRRSPEISETLQTAYEDQASVVRLTQELVQISSRGGIDPYEPVLGRMEGWLHGHGLPCRRLTGVGGMPVALTCEITGKGGGPHYVLDACLDTAPFGDDHAWTYPPVSGEINDGWLHGRGSSDSKAGAAIFAHLAVRLMQTADRWAGRVTLLFDVDEHTGTFAGAKAFFGDGGDRADGVLIGYPGLDHLVTGGRGVTRAHVHVHGIAAHSGASKPAPSAIAKAAELVTRLHGTQLSRSAGAEFPLPPRITVTAISGGEGFSMTPDHCVLCVDARTTPDWDDHEAVGLLRSAAAAIDRSWSATPPTRVEVVTRWPAFALPMDAPLRTAMLAGARASGLEVSAKIAGPSNVGNYLAGLGIPAVAGFGVDYEGLHGTDERIRLDSIPIVQATYHQALLSLLTLP